MNMRRAISFVACSFLYLSTNEAISDESTGLGNFQSLYELCTINAPFCMGYVSGVGHVMGLIGFTQHKGLVAICTGQRGPSMNAMVQAVINYGHEHPEVWSEDMLTTTMFALRQTWPCR
jgi:Rap1a immunity proteins